MTGEIKSLPPLQFDENSSFMAKWRQAQTDLILYGTSQIEITTKEEQEVFRAICDAARRA